MKSLAIFKDLWSEVKDKDLRSEAVMLGLETRSRLETVSRPVSEVLVLVLNSDVLVLVSVLRKKGLENFQDHLFSNVTVSWKIFLD